MTFDSWIKNISKMILIILSQIFILNNIWCQTTVNNSVILSGSLSRLNQSHIIHLIINGQNITEAPIPSETTTNVSETTSNQTTTQTSITTNSSINETTTQSSNSSNISLNNTTTESHTTENTTSINTSPFPNSSEIHSTEESNITEVTTTPLSHLTNTNETTVTPINEGMTNLFTSSTTHVFSTTTESNVTKVAPIVLPTSATSESGVNTVPNSGEENLSTLVNMYPQAMRYSCPHAVNGCKGPTSCLYKHPDCTKFFHCNDAGQAFVMDCPIGLEWNDEQKICDFPQNAQCN